MGGKGEEGGGKETELIIYWVGMNALLGRGLGRREGEVVTGDLPASRDVDG